MKVLLTGTRAPVARDLARVFALCGHAVYGIDSRPSPLCDDRLSGFSLCASPRHRPGDFARDAETLMARLQPDLIIPLCEEVFYWAQLAGHHDWPLFAPPPGLLMRLHSKFAFAQLASEAGLNVPPTQRLSAGDRVADPQGSVFKPEFSRFGARLYLRPSTLPALSHDPRNPWLRQDYIDGEDLCVYAIAHAGRLSAFCAYRSDWRAAGGASYHFQPLPPDLSAPLEAIAARLAAATGLSGQFACDLRRAQDGQFWLLECNPRATSGLHLLCHDPEALCRAFGAPGDDILHTDGQAACVGPAMWLSGLPRAVREGRLARWRHDKGGARDVLKGRAGSALLTGIGLMTEAALLGQSLQSYLTTDIECNRILVPEAVACT